MNKNAIKRQQRRNLPTTGTHGSLAPTKRNESLKTPAISSKVSRRYVLDTYQGIEYVNRLPMPNVDVTLIDTSGFKLTVLPSQIHL